MIIRNEKMLFYLFIYLFLISHFALFDPFRPTYGTPKVLERAGLSMSDIDVFEFHEAFAVSYQKKPCEVV